MKTSLAQGTNVSILYGTSLVGPSSYGLYLYHQFFSYIINPSLLFIENILKVMSVFENVKFLRTFKKMSNK